MNNMIDLITSDGITLKKVATTNGGEYAGSCPWCGGKDRFRAWAERYWCRQCDRKGDAIQYLRDKHSMSFAEASAQMGKDVKPQVKKYQESRWELKNTDGQVVAVHVKQVSDKGKRYWWEIDGNPGLRGLRSVNLPLYGAEFIGKKTGDVIICEGEKAADAVRKSGFMAVATVTGAASCPSIETLKVLKNVNGSILIWPDNDPIGNQHMDLVQEALKSLNIESYLIRWPSAPDKGDAADYIDSGGDLGQLIDRAKRRQVDRGFVPIGDFVVAASGIDDLMVDGVVTGVPTGFNRLDKLIGGWQKGLFYVLCARPGMGKTSLALSFMRKSARLDGKIVFFSLETGKVRIASRLAWLEAGMNRGKVEKEAASYDMLERGIVKDKLTLAYINVQELPILIDDKTGIDTDELRRRLEIIMAKEPVSMVVIDHMGKLGDKGKSAYERMSHISTKLSELPIEYDVPVMAVYQLNRDSERGDRKDKRPRISDLRDSGRIEEDARVILGLYRDTYYKDACALPELTQLMVLKNNEGDARTVAPLHCDYNTRQWSDWPESRNNELKSYFSSCGWLS